MLTGKIEMGQGVMTSLAQMAEELDVPLSSMRVVMEIRSCVPNATAERGISHDCSFVRR